MNRDVVLKGLVGILPTPYTEDLEIHTRDLRAEADFACRNGQHGIVWPVMASEYYLLGESERLRNLDALLEEVNGRLPVVFGCGGQSVPQSALYARAAQQAGADAIVGMTPAQADFAAARTLFHRLSDSFDGPIVLQNPGGHGPFTSEQIAALVEEIPRLEYVKEERQPGPRYVAEVRDLVGGQVKTIFSGAAGKFLPAELSRGANGCMASSIFGDLLGAVFERWWAGDEAGARELHTRLLPLLNLAGHYFARYMLKRRGVISSLQERAPSAHALDDEDKREITVLLRAVERDVRVFPFGGE